MVIRGDVKLNSSPGSGTGDPILTRDATSGIVGEVGAIDVSVYLPVSLTSGNVYIGNASNIATSTALTGDVVVSNTGVTSISSNVIVDADINSSAAIALTKLAATTASRVLVSDASGFISPSSVTSTELGYVSGVTSSIQTQLDSKQATITGGATTIVSSNLTVSRLLVSDGSGKVAVSSVTSTEAGYLSGVTSSIQTQLSAKQSSIQFEDEGVSIGSLGGVNSVDFVGAGVSASHSGGTVTVTIPGTANGLPAGGTTGQYLIKDSGVDYDASWDTLELADITDVTATVAEVNILSGTTVSSTELNHLDGITGNVQTQIDGKLDNVLTENYIFVGNASNQPQAFAAGADGYVLKSIGGVPTWDAGIQDTIKYIVTDSGTATADQADDTFNTVGGDGIQTSATGKTITLALDGITMNRIINSATMGLLEGGELSINADPTKFNVSAGSGIIIDNYTDVDNPVVYPVSWGAFTAVVPTYIATNTSSHILIERSGLSGIIRQQTSYPTPEQHRDYIYLGQLGHANLTTIAAVINKPEIAVAPADQLRDFEDFIGLVNSGNLVSANGANLKIDKTIGYLQGSGINFHINNKNPNVKFFAAQVAASLRLRTQTGLGATGVTDIDPGNYDVGGVITSITGTKYTNQRVFLTVAGNIVIQYGQQLYNTLNSAIAGIKEESFTVLENLVDNAFPICVLSVKSSATTLNDASQAKFSFPTKFGELNAAAAGVSISTLQNAYNNSTPDPEILTDSINGAVTLQRGSAADTDDVLTIKNGAGTVVSSITGEGNVVVADEVYGISWNGSMEVPTKNALYDKIETISGGGGHTIQDEGTPLTQRTNLNFVGSSVAVTDDSGNDATVVTISGGAGQSLGASFDGMGVVVLVNSIFYIRAKSAMTITGWSIIAEGTSPTCTIDIFKIASGTTLPTASICASALPALATGNAIKSTTLTGWTTSVAADDMLAFKVTACSAATKIQIVLYP